MSRRTMLWVAAALLGIAATATVAWSASRLAASGVGLAGTPLSVTAGLAPPSAPAHPRTRSRGESKRHAKPRSAARPAASRTSTAAPLPSTPSPLPVTPTPPVSTAGAPPVITTPPASATTSPSPATTAHAPARQPSASHRDDSGGGGGGGGSGHGRDD